MLYTSSSSPAINKHRRLLPATSVINSPWSVAAECIALGGRTAHVMRWSQIMADNRDFCLPYLNSTPWLGEFPSEYCNAVWYEKTTVVWLYPMVKNFEGMFIRFDRIHERDRPRQTRSYDGIGRACIASRGKNRRHQASFLRT